MSVEAARTFKDAVRDHLATTGAAVARSSPLTASEGVELVAAAGGMAGLIYRATNPPPVLAQVYLEDPELAATHLAMQPVLVRLLSALAAGLPTLREPRGR